MLAVRISVHNAKQSRTIRVRLVIKTSLLLVDFVETSSNSHPQAWNQHSETYAVNQIASRWCRSLATRCFHVAIHVGDALVKRHAYRVWSLNVLKRWLKPKSQMYVQMIFVQFVMRRRSVKNHAWGSIVDTYSIKNACWARCRKDGMDRVWSLIILIVQNARSK